MWWSFADSSLVLEPDVDAALAQSVDGVPAHLLADLGKDPVGHLDQHEAQVALVDGWVVAGRVPGHVLGLGERLDAGVPAADEDEGQGGLSRAAGSRTDAARSSRSSTWLRRAMASSICLKPIPCSARPGIGSVREIEPSATTSSS